LPTLGPFLQEGAAAKKPRAGLSNFPVCKKKAERQGAVQNAQVRLARPDESHALAKHDHRSYQDDNSVGTPSDVLRSQPLHHLLFLFGQLHLALSRELFCG
jgi:hypothetical protein